jgi:hypothetical protein
MHGNLGLLGLGIGFIIMAGGLFALTLRKPKEAPVANPNSKQQREQAALDEEKKKMRIGAAVVAGFGLVLIAIS